VWRELALSPGYLAPVSRFVSLGGGARFAAAALHVLGAPRVNGAPSSPDVWNARATLEARLEVALSKAIALNVRPEFGATLRHLVLTDQRGVEHRVGGTWLGLGVGLVLGSSSRAALQ
jgi:hypothetical protein